MSTHNNIDDNHLWDIYINSCISDSHMTWSGPDARGDLPLPAPIHIITASNPHQRILSDHENQQRNSQLLLCINKLNCQSKPVIGHSHDRRWQEHSFAIHGLSRVQACYLASSFDQHAIYELTEDLLLVIEACTHDVKKQRTRSIHPLHEHFIS